MTSTIQRIGMILLLAAASHALAEPAPKPATAAEELASEVATRGWIVYSSRTEKGA